MLSLAVNASWDTSQPGGWEWSLRKAEAGGGGEGMPLQPLPEWPFLQGASALSAGGHWSEQISTQQLEAGKPHVEIWAVVLPGVQKAVVPPLVTRLVNGKVADGQVNKQEAWSWWRAGLFPSTHRHGMNSPAAVYLSCFARA